jgi:hypothetical protein
MGTQKKQSSKSRRPIPKKAGTAKPVKRGVGGSKSRKPSGLKATPAKPKREVGANRPKLARAEAIGATAVKRKLDVKLRKPIIEEVSKEKGIKRTGDAGKGPLKKLIEAEGRLEARYSELGAAFLGPVKSKDMGTIWNCAKGCLVHNDDKLAVFEIHGAIYEKWQKLGGLKWGIPNTDETKAPDGVGRYNHFNKDTASIYWTQKTGANGVWGEIRKRWAELGWEKSYLGYPTCDELDFTEGGRFNEFQNGGIYFWKDVGAIDLRDVVVNYTGLHCFGETDNDQTFSGGDEPYAIMGVTTPQAPATFRSKIYEDIDAGQSCPDLIELFRGRPCGINIVSLVMEHDAGDQDRYKDEVTKIVELAHEGGKKALGAIPIVGAGLAAAAEKLDKFVPVVGAKINDWLDFGDDVIGSANLSLSAREMVMLAARTDRREYDGIGFKVETNLISGQGASYKVYFELIPA